MAKQPLLVFDCDYTLWPFDCDKEVIAPFHAHAGNIIDAYWRPANPFPEVSAVFEYILEHDIPFAIASRNQSAPSIRQLLQAIKIKNTNIWNMLPGGWFHAYSSGGMKGKTLHFMNISQATGRPLSDMLFFDDLLENIKVASRLGVTSVHVSHLTGLTMAAFMCGIEGYAKAQRQKIEATAAAQEGPPK
jgi:magnesium-dependent phosphatase-1